MDPIFAYKDLFNESQINVDQILSGNIVTPNITLTDDTNQILAGTANPVTINITGVSSTVNLNGVTGGTNIVTTDGVQTINDVKTFTSALTNTLVSNQIILGGTNKVTISSSAPGGNRTYTIPDTLTNSSFVMSDLAQTVNGVKTFTSAFTNSLTSNQLILGATNTVTVSASAPSVSRIYTMQDVGSSANFIMSEGNQTINGNKTFTGTTSISSLSVPFLTATNTTNQLILGVTNTTTISSVAPTSSRIYTIPDAGTNSSFVMTDLAQTINGIKTFTSAFTNSLTSNQIVLGTTNKITISSTAPVSSQTYTLPDTAANSSFIMSDLAQTINGIKTFTSAFTNTLTSNQIVLGNTNTVTISSVAPSVSRTYTINDVGTNANFIMSEGGQTINGAKSFSGQVAITATTNQLLLGTIRTVTITAPTPATSSRTHTVPDVSADASFVMTEGAQTINASKTFTGVTNFTNTTDSSNSGTGCVVLSGGLGIAKKIVTNSSILFNTAVALPSTTVPSIHRRTSNLGLSLFGPDTGGVIISCLNSNTGLEDIVAEVSYDPANLKSSFSVQSDLDVISGTNAAAVIVGGCSVQKKLQVGSQINCTLTTDATSSTTGAIKTAGGLGVAKTAYFGTGIFLPSFGALSPSLFDFYSTESFNANSAGAWGLSAPVISGQLTRIGNMVFYRYAQTLAASSAAASIAWTTNLPAIYRPSVQQDIDIVVDSAGTFQMGLMRVPTGATGILAFATVGTASFPAAGTIGFLGKTVSWSIL